MSFAVVILIRQTANNTHTNRSLTNMGKCEICGTRTETTVQAVCGHRSFVCDICKHHCNAQEETHLSKNLCAKCENVDYDGRM